jgi:hypothetical protein
VNGKRVPRDKTQASGWNWGANYESLQVFGAACDDLLATPPTTVELILGCPGVAP